MMHRTGAVAAVIALAVFSAPGVAAEPPIPNPAPSPVPATGVGPGGTTLSARDLGSSEAISFYIPRDVASSSTGFQVPPGMTPVAMRANIELPVRLRYGNLAVSQDNRTLFRTELPATDGAEMVIPLTGARVYGNYLNLSMTMTALPLEGYCWDSDAPVRLSNIRVTFAGKELPPTTVADFLPPVARRVTIGLPAKPSPAESDAAVQVAAIVASRYGGQNPDITLVPLPAGAAALPGQPGPFERRIVVKEGGAKGLSLQGGPATPSLLVSGSGRELTEQAVLLSDDAAQYALSLKVDTEKLPAAETLLGDSTTFKALNEGGLSSQALWPQVGLEVNQTRFGHPIGDIRVHLIGSYTPIPGNFGGEVLVRVGGEVLDRWPTDAAGIIDRSITVPNTLLKRSTTIEVGIHTTGQTGYCGEHLPMQLRIDGDTGIEVSPLNPPLPAGFQSLPQALMPRIRVGIGADAFGDTSRAAQIVIGLQGSSGVPLLTEVTDLQQAAAGSDPAVLVSSAGWSDTSVALPFNADQGRVTVAGVDANGESVSLDLDPEIKYGSLQIIYDGQRTLLVATSNGAPAQLDELLRWAAAERGRWSGLNGRAVISVPGSQPVTVPVPPDDRTEKSAAPTSEGGANLFWLGVGGVAALAGLGAILILWRARRSGRSVELHEG